VSSIKNEKSRAQSDDKTIIKNEEASPNSQLQPRLAKKMMSVQSVKRTEVISDMTSNHMKNEVKEEAPASIKSQMPV